MTGAPATVTTTTRLPLKQTHWPEAYAAGVAYGREDAAYRLEHGIPTRHWTTKVTDAERYTYRWHFTRGYRDGARGA